MSNNAARHALATTASPGNRAPAETSATNDLRALIQQQKTGIASALSGTALDPERFTRIALTVVRQNRKLMACRANTVLGALMTCAQLGLEPGPLGEAYLVPYGDVCTFLPGYRGLVKLAWNSGQIKHIDADVVYEDDLFDYEKGTSPFLRHKPARGERNTVNGATHAYAVVSMTNGGSSFVVLSVEEVERIRRTYSKSGHKNDNPWQTEWSEMAKKTVLRRLSKIMPLSAGVNLALAAEGTVRTNVEQSIEEAAATVDGEVVAAETGPNVPVNGDGTAPEENR